MNWSLFVYAAMVAVLALLLVWAWRGNKKRPKGLKEQIALLDGVGRSHATYLPLIRQALSAEDAVFLRRSGTPELAERLDKERRRVTIAYLAALREDYARLLRIAKVIAVMSPEVSNAQEADRAWLNVQFAVRYQLLRITLYAGILPHGRLDALSHMVSQMAVRMETAISELGERAAVATQLASSLDRRGADVT